MFASTRVEVIKIFFFLSVRWMVNQILKNRFKKNLKGLGFKLRSVNTYNRNGKETYLESAFLKSLGFKGRFTRSQSIVQY